MTARIKLTPQMAEYEQKFTDGGEVRWLPYLMYFHPTDHSSEVVNTDASGFRYSELLGIQY
ncbi:SGNH/GDSL hydrolase family protein, partial [Pseudomonas chlororaphis]|nr:SGNH/GDSL hydrolase family protein [Pseudomonas chlororaphis]